MSLLQRIRRRCRTFKSGSVPSRSALTKPFELGIRKLEERRVLDVSAAFLAGTGTLTIDIEGPAETATLAAENGELVVRDGSGAAVPILVEADDLQPLRVNSLNRLQVSGDAEAAQTFVLDTILLPSHGVFIEDSIERAELNQSIASVTDGEIDLRAAELHLSSDLEAATATIRVGGDQVVLHHSAQLTAAELTLAAAVDDDGNLVTPSTLTLNASDQLALRAPVGQQQSIDRLAVSSRATELASDIAVRDGLHFETTLTLTDDVRIRGEASSSIVFAGEIASQAGRAFDLELVGGQLSFEDSIGARADGQLGNFTVVSAAGGVTFGAEPGIGAIRTTGRFQLGSQAAVGGDGIILRGRPSSGLFLESGAAGLIMNGPVELQSDVMIVSHGGDIRFTSHTPLNSQPNTTHMLSVDAGGATLRFDAPLGEQTPLAAIDLRADSGIIVAAPVVNSTGTLQLGSVSRPIRGAGIVLGGPGLSTALTTTGDAVELYGATTLAGNVIIDTGAGAGNIRFAGDGTIDSAVGQESQLLLNAGSGRIQFSGDVGRQTRLASLEIVRADAGVELGTSREGSTASFVSVYRTAGDLTIGSAAPIGGGIMIGVAARETQIATGGGDLVLNGPTVAHSPLAVETSGGGLTLTAATTLDSGQDGPVDVLVNAGTGVVSFNANLGGQQRLGALLVERADGGVWFGESITRTLDGRGPIETINVGRVEIGSPAHAIRGAGITFAGTITDGATLAVHGGEVVLHGAVTLASHVRIESAEPNGAITFTDQATINSGNGGPRSLTLDAGHEGVIRLNADVGGQMPLAGFLIERAAAVFVGMAPSGPYLGGPVNTFRVDGDLQFGSASTIHSGIEFHGGSSGTVIETSGGDVRVDGAVQLWSDLSIFTGPAEGDIHFTAAASVDSADSSATSASFVLNAGRGAIELNGNLGQGRRLRNVVVEAAANGVTLAGSSSAANPMTLVATEGAIEFRSPLAGELMIAHNTGTFRFDSSGGDILLDRRTAFQSTVVIATSAGVGDFRAPELAPSRNQLGSRPDLILELGQGSGDIGFADAAAELATLRVASVHDFSAWGSFEVSRLVQQAGSGISRFAGGPVVVTGGGTDAVDLTGSGFELDASLFALQGGMSIRHRELLRLAPAANILATAGFFESGSGSVELGADIVTGSGPIEFANAVRLVSDVRMDTAADQTNHGEMVRFGGALDGVHTLSIDAGRSGNIEFLGPVGVNAPLEAVRIATAADVLVTNRVESGSWHQLAGEGATTFEGKLQLANGAGPAFSVTTRQLSFQDTVTAGADVVFSITEMLTIGADADFSVQGSLTQQGPAIVRLAADIDTAAGIAFAGPVQLADTSLLSAAGSEGILFFDRVDTSQMDAGLTLAAPAGAIEFAGDVGTLRPLRSLSITSSAGLHFQGGLATTTLRQLAGSGVTRFSGSVSVNGAAEVLIRTADLVIEDRFDTSLRSASLLIQVSGGALLQDQVRAGEGSVVVEAGGKIELGEEAMVTAGRSIRLSSGSGGAEPVMAGSLTMADGSLLSSGDEIALISAGNLTLGRLEAAGLVSLEAGTGSVTDGGDSGGVDIRSTSLIVQAAVGIGNENPLETEVLEFSGGTAAGGGIRIDNFAPRLTIVDSGLGHGIVNGFSIPDPERAGVVEIISRGKFLVAAAVRNDAGSDTRLRAGLSESLILVAPVRNRGGDGSIQLFAGRDLEIRDSVPDSRAEPLPGEAEVSVEGRGAVVGIAGNQVVIANDRDGFALIRTHAERVSDSASIPAIPIPDPARDPAGYEAALRQIRESVAPQIVHLPPLIRISSVDANGTSIGRGGRAVLQVEIGNAAELGQLERNFHLLIDWGDGTVESLPVPLSGDTTIPRFDSGRLRSDGSLAPVTYSLEHIYTENPNRENPAAPIPVSVEIRFDPRSEGELAFDNTFPPAPTGVLHGIRFFENLTEEVVGVDTAEFQVPGLGQNIFLKVVESVVTPIESRPEAARFLPPQTPNLPVETGEAVEFAAATFESEVIAEYRVFLKVVNEITGEELDHEINLPLETLEDPIAFFTNNPRFPTGRYRIYLEEIRTQRTRLIVEVQIYEGRVVPQNFRESSGERQPGTAAPGTAAPVEPRGPLPDAREPGAGGAAARPAGADQQAQPEADEAVSQQEPGAAAAVGVLASARPRRLSRAARLCRRIRASSLSTLK